MDLPIKGIPTTYNGTRFRSRLEARWAAFFDLAGWRWEYEPFDLSGWIPDFGLIGHDGRTALVEVKPAVQCPGDVLAKALNGIGASDHDFLFFGSAFKIDHGEYFDVINLQTCTAYDRSIGKHCITNRGLWKHDDGGALDFVPGGPPYLFHFRGDTSDRSSAEEGYVGADEFAGHIIHGRGNYIIDIWRQAGNTVQWKAR